MATGRHRDAFKSWELDEYYNSGENPFARNQYAQDKGTDVLIFSMGNTEMKMGLSFPHSHPIHVYNGVYYTETLYTSTLYT